jgi:XRE family aerobic/anaerobic benzoate catabolism transcriptional regulator
MERTIVHMLMDPRAFLSGLGRRARSLRSDRGWTLQELSARTGLSARFLVEVESGRGNISVRNLAFLAGALGTTPAALLSPPEERPGGKMIALLGLRGAGKTAIGRRLARRLRLPFVELDRRVERAAGLSLGEIFRLHGEAYYRRLERETLEGVLSEKDGRPRVLAAGGGLVTSPEAYARLRAAALTIWLRAMPEDHWNRVLKQGDRRPMAEHPEAMAELRSLLASREPLYAQADHTVDTSRLGIEGATRAILGLLARPRAGVRLRAASS